MIHFFNHHDEYFYTVQTPQSLDEKTIGKLGREEEEEKREQTRK
jgi:hypothetical protein